MNYKSLNAQTDYAEEAKAEQYMLLIKTSPKHNPDNICYYVGRIIQISNISKSTTIISLLLQDNTITEFDLNVLNVLCLNLGEII